jgi:hypothetical protein
VTDDDARGIDLDIAQGEIVAFLGPRVRARSSRST